VAKELGADETLNAAEDDVYQEVLKHTGMGLVNVIYDGVGYIKGCPGEPVIIHPLFMHPVLFSISG